jgi:hypothetical protein
LESRTNIQRVRRSSLALIAAVVVLSLTAGCLSSQAPHTTPASCPGSAVTAISNPQDPVDEIGLDVSVSTESASLRASYEASALGQVSAASLKKAALRIVSFGASGVGAKIVFEGSFAPVSDDDVYNVASQNRASCWAKQATKQALATRTRPHDGGTDVAGAVSSLITNARSLMAPRGAASVTLFTDGCQAPSPSGPNRELTDLCGLLSSGESSAQILRAHSAEFSLGDAHGIAIEMKGVGISRNQNEASTTFARRLVSFWTTVCRKANARSCQIGSAVS